MTTGTTLNQYYRILSTQMLKGTPPMYSDLPSHFPTKRVQTCLYNQQKTAMEIR